MMEFLFIFKEALVNMMGKMLYIVGELNLILVFLLWEAIDTYRSTYYIIVYIHISWYGLSHYMHMQH